MVGSEITSLKKQIEENFSIDVSVFEGVIAFFMPSVENVGSQIQIRSISEKYDYIKSIGWEIAIVSEDDKQTLELFRTKYEIPYFLCSAKNTNIAEVLDIQGKLGTMKRATILFNREFEIIKRFHEVLPGSHYNNVLNWIENNTNPNSQFNPSRSNSGLEEA